MAFYQDANGESIGNRLRQKQFPGLTNDERVVAEGYCRSYVSALEVQKIGPDGHMTAIDLLGKNAEPVLLIDRAVSEAALPFAILFAWFLPSPGMGSICRSNSLFGCAGGNQRLWKRKCQCGGIFLELISH